jgi:hypothetical protein
MTRQARATLVIASDSETIHVLLCFARRIASAYTLCASADLNPP